MAQEFASVRSEMQALRIHWDNKFETLEYRLTIKLGSIVSIAIGIAVTLAKLL